MITNNPLTTVQRMFEALHIYRCESAARETDVRRPGRRKKSFENVLRTLLSQRSMRRNL
jgi:hypothetical protein